jgi:hypothetical protein
MAENSFRELAEFAFAVPQASRFLIFLPADLPSNPDQ